MANEYYLAALWIFAQDFVKNRFIVIFNINKKYIYISLFINEKDVSPPTFSTLSHIASLKLFLQISARKNYIVKHIKIPLENSYLTLVVW